MKNKQILSLFLLGMTLGINGYAQQVSQREAVQAAINTIRYEKNGDANRQVDTVFAKIMKNDTLMYEVLFDDGNIVLLAGNKACIPVLGIILLEATDTNSISSVVDTNSIFAGGDNVPDGLIDFLDDYEQQITYCFRNNITGYYSRLWQQLQTYDSNYLRNGIEVGPFISTKWGQSESNDKRASDRDPYAYNALVSENGLHCDKCLAGCVAVAMAQIMKVWDYPKGNPQRCLEFNWSNMPNALLLQDNSNYNVEKLAIAYLLRDCGQLANMHYCSNHVNCGSGSVIDSACQALRMYGYSDIFPLQRSEYPGWIPLLIDELDNERPIDYFGKNGLGYGGHSFVCDGYKERPLLGGYKFHFNWGWNGKKDGWFVLDKLTPGNHNFSFTHQAIFNIYPTGCYLNIVMKCGKFFSSGMVEEYTAIDSFQNDGYAYIIGNNASIHLQAGEEILLTNGFYAALGSDFHATIAPCSSAATSFPNHLADGITDDNPLDTLPAPKSLQTEVSPVDDDALTFYPNPTDDLLFVELRGAGIANVALYDLQGRVVETLRATSLQDGTATLNVKSLPAGVYVLRVKDAEGREYQQKVVRR